MSSETFSTATRRWSPRRRRIAAFLVIATVSLCAAAVVFRRPWFQGNFAVVRHGLVYRSAQPGEELGDRIATLGLATVLDLRGGSFVDAWYRREVEIAQARGVDFYDFPMNATRRPTRRELLALVDLLDRCRYPLLIHCKSGSDRTGLVSALYLLMVEGRPPSEAARAFSVAYGHIPLFGTERLHEPLDEYSAWLAQEGLPHAPARFKTWLSTRYVPDEPLTQVEPIPEGPRELRLRRARADRLPKVPTR